MSPGIVPALVLTIFLGIFALYTAKVLIDFKLNHPEVHNMGNNSRSLLFSPNFADPLIAGDAGAILFGRAGREILSAGTVIFAIFAAVSRTLLLPSSSSS